MREVLFLMGCKTFVVCKWIILALMLILPRSDCTVLNVKHVIIPSVVSVEISHFLNKRAVLLCPAKLLPCATPAALPEQPARSAGWFGAL